MQDTLDLVKLFTETTGEVVPADLTQPGVRKTLLLLENELRAWQRKAQALGLEHSAARLLVELLAPAWAGQLTAAQIAGLQARLQVNDTKQLDYAALLGAGVEQHLAQAETTLLHGLARYWPHAVALVHESRMRGYFCIPQDTADASTAHYRAQGVDVCYRQVRAARGSTPVYVIRRASTGQVLPLLTYQAADLSAYLQQKRQLATSAQKERIISLLNHPLITRQEKTRMLLALNRLDYERAEQAVGKLRTAIDARENGSSVVA